ncbi:mechanosensitive ion channel protein [Rhizobium sp. Root274]|uniref:mechanosensitive ion channel domain-containing protein n=1 Tax=unclassified Rhizobium TaxID=2613769 RepID=UPI00071314C1|nr:MULTISPECIES: mechanosensitive ion channel domain-containing protein [unclassified Rhizobium]KQW28763.1 mechanosensitive ion channel protein [Rhizobium sp. Root1240]KRD28959.1 mechanosensitive ion channel protein [Rhizobium sp. Root274]
MYRLRPPRLALALCLASFFLSVAVSPDGVLAQQQDPAPPAAASEAPSAAPPSATDQTAVPAAQPPAAEPPVAPEPTRDEQLAAAGERLAAAKKQLSQLREQVDKHEQDDSLLAELKVKVDALVRDVLQVSVDLRPRLNDVQTRLTELGAAPADGQPPEAASVTDERSRLNAARAEINAITGQAEDLSIEAKSLSDRISDIRRAIFTNALFAHTEINSQVFDEATGSFWSDAERVRRSISSWLVFVVKFKAVPLTLALLLSLALASVILYVEKRFFKDIKQRDLAVEDPSYMSRFSVAFWSTILPSMALSFFLASAYFLLDTFNVLRPDIAPIAAAFFALIGLVFFVTAVSRAVLAPSAANWRLVKLSNKGARDISIAIFLMAVVNGLDYLLAVISDAYSSPVVLTVMKSLGSSVIVGFLLFFVSFLRPVLSDKGDPNAPGRPWPRAAAVTLRAIGVLLILLAGIGYIGLSRFLATQIIVTGAVVATMYIGILSGKAISAPNQFGETRVGRYIARRFKLGPVGLDQSGIAAGLLIYMFALVAGLPLILMSWGFQLRDMQLWLFNLFTEINIGTIRISIFGILGGLLLFVVGLMLTRWFQKWLDGNVMARSQVDGGVRNSVKMGVGYLGTGIAGIVGISAAGIDLSSLALVAGALSLGIGFGLQNIVSNFVSGLILLVERPFKVGDHVITGVNEGIVKRISVRATEIETFRRQSIIVPNSELINTPLGNWTHRNRVQRSEIPVSVAYDADPQEVIDVLLEVVNGMPDILRNPEPHVEFLRFGASSLDFELRFHLADMSEGLNVRNRVRMEILQAFRARGIVMPYPHQDVMLHVREQDRHVLVRRRAKTEAGRVAEPDELPAAPDDDKLLP